jgi:hypothetical protein
VLKASFEVGRILASYNIWPTYQSYGGSSINIDRSENGRECCRALIVIHDLQTASIPQTSMRLPGAQNWRTRRSGAGLELQRSPVPSHCRRGHSTSSCVFAFGFLVECPAWGNRNSGCQDETRLRQGSAS